MVFISNAYAQGAAGAAGGEWMGFLPIVLMFAVLYFLMIRPQMKRAKEHRNMVEALKKGDEVVTNGGIAGRVTKVGEQYVTVEIARTNSKDGGQPVEVKMQKAAVQTLLPNGSLKDI
ncbi:MAG: preprotein translocase subunit YajC [Burkholderiaceae bacterium]